LSRAVQKTCCQVSEWARLEKRMDGLEGKGKGITSWVSSSSSSSFHTKWLLIKRESVCVCLNSTVVGLSYKVSRKGRQRERTSEVFHRHGGTKSIWQKTTRQETMR